MTIQIAAYAKLNLSLRVLRRRTDGYHEILSDVQTIDLADSIEIELGGEGVRVHSNLVFSETDIVELAAVALLKRKRSTQGVAIRVEKRIPVGAGLGGGSSDAAATLAVLDRVIPPELPFRTLCEIGSTIGSDVPLFLHGGAIRMGGRGERIEKLPAQPRECYVVLVPSVHCATQEIYSRWDVGDASPIRRATRLERGENDLLQAALSAYPSLSTYHGAVGQLNAAYSGMSGSGSSFYGAFAEEVDAEHARRTLSHSFPSADVFVCHPTAVGHRIRETQ